MIRVSFSALFSWLSSSRGAGAAICCKYTIKRKAVQNEGSTEVRTGLPVWFIYQIHLNPRSRPRVSDVHLPAGPPRRACNVLSSILSCHRVHMYLRYTRTSSIVCLRVFMSSCPSCLHVFMSSYFSFWSSSRTILCCVHAGPSQYIHTAPHHRPCMSSRITL